MPASLRTAQEPLLGDAVAEAVMLRTFAVMLRRKLRRVSVCHKAICSRAAVTRWILVWALMSALLHILPQSVISPYFDRVLILTMAVVVVVAVVFDATRAAAPTLAIRVLEALERLDWEIASICQIWQIWREDGSRGSEMPHSAMTAFACVYRFAPLGLRLPRTHERRCSYTGAIHTLSGLPHGYGEWVRPAPVTCS